MIDRLLPVVLLSAVISLGCDKQDEAKKDEPKADAGKEDEAKKDEPKEGEEANFADPQVEPPPAPEGSVAIKDPWLYIQTCTEAHPCPDLLQGAGDAHCRELRLGNHEGWRLPSKEEVPRFSGVEGVEATAGYHWTRTPYADDNKQVWIVDPDDPTGAPATTIPRDRKPFRIRCVKEP